MKNIDAEKTERSILDRYHQLRARCNVISRRKTTFRAVILVRQLTSIRFRCTWKREKAVV